MKVQVKAHRRGTALVRAFTRNSTPGRGSALRELRYLQHRQTKAIEDSVRIYEGKRIKQLLKAVAKKRDKTRMWKLKAGPAYRKAHGR